MPRAKVNGAEIYYEEAGSGPPMILSPGGLQGVLESYQPVLEGLSRAHRVIAYDRRFGGQSKSPMVVQTWDQVCRDVVGLMDVLGIGQASLGGGSFGAAISLGCAARYPDRVKAIFPSNLAGGVICDAYLATKLYRSIDMALTQGMKAVVATFDRDDRFAPFVPERVQDDPGYRRDLEAMPPEEYAQVMRDTIYALFDGPYPSLGATVEMLKGIRTRTLVMPGNNDIHPRRVAELVHRLYQLSWGVVPPTLKRRSSTSSASSSSLRRLSLRRASDVGSLQAHCIARFRAAAWLAPPESAPSYWHRLGNLGEQPQGAFERGRPVSTGGYRGHENLGRSQGEQPGDSVGHPRFVAPQGDGVDHGIAPGPLRDFLEPRGAKHVLVKGRTREEAELLADRRSRLLDVVMDAHRRMGN